MKIKKYLRTAVIILLVIFAGLFWWHHYFVFGEGVKSGDLNFLVKKGYVFKTWEGRLIQTGFKSNSPGALQSNEFNFSVTNDSIAQVLERASGKTVELRYKEYLKPLPWRGVSNYVVIEILSIDNKEDNHKY
jgi:hypothetical protein